MHGIGVMFVVAFAGVAWAVLRPRPKTPLSERACLRVLRLAAWLEHLGTAWDGAILRYRLERRACGIELDSTAERLGRRAA